MFSPNFLLSIVRAESAKSTTKEWWVFDHWRPPQWQPPWLTALCSYEYATSSTEMSFTCCRDHQIILVHLVLHRKLPCIDIITLSEVKNIVNLAKLLPMLQTFIWCLIMLLHKWHMITDATSSEWKLHWRIRRSHLTFSYNPCEYQPDNFLQHHDYM